MKKYLLYYVSEHGKFKEEYTEEELLKFDKKQSGYLSECAANMINHFNRTLRKGEVKRHFYKLECIEITTTLICSNGVPGMDLETSDLFSEETQIKIKL